MKSSLRLHKPQVLLSSPARSRSVQTRASISNQTPTFSEASVRRTALVALVAGIAGISVLAQKSNAKEAAEDRVGEVKHSDEDWRSLLSPESYAVLRQAATERRGTSELLSVKRKGVFVCAGCGNPLYKTEMKYESGTGWPSFYDAIPGAIDTTVDDSFFMRRVEVRCHRCQGHLGHVFEDGPKPTGLRYCMNGVAMKFEPSAEA